MRFSKFVHFFDTAESAVGAYHSLLVKTIFFERYEFKNINSYLDQNEFASKEIEKTVEYLYQQYFIVKSPEEDDALYNKMHKPNIAVRNIQCLCGCH